MKTIAAVLTEILSRRSASCSTEDFDNWCLDAWSDDMERVIVALADEAEAAIAGK
jgi:hypothetical protein